jgi:hypothetical protein
MPAYLHALNAAGFDGGMALDLYSCDYEAVSEKAIATLKQYLNQVLPTSSTAP